MTSVLFHRGCGIADERLEHVHHAGLAGRDRGRGAVKVEAGGHVLGKNEDLRGRCRQRRKSQKRGGGGGQKLSAARHRGSHFLVGYFRTNHAQNGMLSSLFPWRLAQRTSSYLRALRACLKTYGRGLNVGKPRESKEKIFYSLEYSMWTTETRARRNHDHLRGRYQSEADASRAGVIHRR